MRLEIVKLKPKRRCRIRRRPHPDLDFFFGRYERAVREPGDDPRCDIADREPQSRSPRRHRNPLSGIRR